MSTELKEVKELKEKMEEDILLAINLFEHKTGLSVQNVYLEKATLQTGKNVVVNVCCEVLL